MNEGQPTSAPTTVGTLAVFVGDSGSGGTKGLVPAPVAGDAAKFLKGNGTWATVTSGATLGANTFTGAQTIALGVTATITPLSITGSVNNYYEGNIQNTSNGITASSDFVATADTGNATTKFADWGINGSGWTGTTWGAALDSYGYCDGGDLWLGTQTASKVVRINAGGGAAANTVATFAAAGVTLKGTTTIDTALTGILQATAGVVSALAGALGPTNGGTGQSSYTLGDTLYSSASNTLAKLAGNTTTTQKFLTQTGSGAASAAPVWNALALTDLPAGSVGKSITLSGAGTIPAGAGLTAATPPIMMPASLGVATAYSPGTTGVWVGMINILWPGVTSITFVDLTGINGFGNTNLSPAAISLPSATSIVFTALTTVIGSVTFTAPSCTTFTASAFVSTTSNLTFTTFNVLATFAMNAFTTCGNALNLAGLSAISSFSMTGLTTVISTLTFPSSTACATYSFPALTSAGSISTSGNTYGATLTTLAFGALTTVGDPSATQNAAGITLIGTHNSVTTLTLSALATVNVVGNGIVINNMGALTTLSLAGLVTINHGIGSSLSLTTGTAALATLTFGAVGVTKKISGNIIISSCALNQASVDGILARLVALDGTGGTTLYTGAKTVTITGTSSTPSATGLTDKATLVGRGCTVTTN